MKNLRMALCGLAGAAAATAAHQAVRGFVPDAPRMDVLGMRSIEGMMKRFNIPVPQGLALYNTALAGDIISNSIYFSPIGTSSGAGAMMKGLGLGLMAGLGAVKLPPLMGLPSEPSNKTPRTAALTIGIYVVGGVAAALVANMLPGHKKG